MLMGSSEFAIFIFILVMILLMMNMKRFFKIIIFSIFLLSALSAVKLFPYMMNSLYEYDEGIGTAILYESTMPDAAAERIDLSEYRYVMCDYSGEYLRFIGLKRLTREGYVKKYSGTIKLTGDKSAKIKMLFFIPYMLILLVILYIIEPLKLLGLRREKEHPAVKVEKRKEPDELETSITVLKKKLEAERIRYSEYISLQDEIDKLKEITYDHVLSGQIDNIEQKLKRLKEKSGYHGDLEKRLAECRDFIDEAVLRVEFDDFKGAVNSVQKNLHTFLTGISGGDGETKDVVEAEYRNRVINFELRQDLIWFINLRNTPERGAGGPKYNPERLQRLFEGLRDLREKVRLS